MHESTVGVVSVNSHKAVCIVWHFFGCHYSRLFRRRVNCEIVFLSENLAHCVLLIVYFKFVCLLTGEITDCEFLVINLDLQKNEYQLAGLNRFCKLFELS